LRRQIYRREAAVELALERDVEPRILSARTVIGEVQRLFDQCVEVDHPALARDPARVFEHALDDAVGALAVLSDLVEVAAQHVDDLVDLGARGAVERGRHRRRRLL
jgi:hypothetical protein